MKKNVLIILGLGLLLSACNNKPPIHARYEGKDISGIAEIQRDKNSKAATLEINTDGKWSLYAGRTMEDINFFEPILEGNGSGKYTLSVPDSVRSYFELDAKDSQAILAERHLPMSGGYNFRDLGGMKTKDGHFIKWGKIFRSDGMGDLTDADLKYLSSIPITSIVDFRSEAEIEQAPDKLPCKTTKHYIYSITPENLNATDGFRGVTPDGADSFMIRLNIQLITDSLFVSRYKDFFTLLQNEDNAPLLFHCSAGKDRTGIGAALILFALGVDEDTIMKDYLSSNDYLRDKYGPSILLYPQAKSVFQVKPEFLQAGIEKIKNDYGSVENFLEKELKVDIPQFRKMYLYDFKINE